MSVRDIFHDAVKTALIKDGWTITDDPLRLEVGGVSVAIDLAAEQLIAAERKGQKIAVEVKSFLIGASAISEFHTALGQFLNYRAVLQVDQPDRELYFAIPTTAHNTFFQLPIPASQVQTFGLKLLVYDPTEEVIELWKN
ncbi:MAG: fatty-acid oxidation protein subunit alpha [Cyanothece sp. SIO2G6]|nr:fatty-acid oxidation protein subunit alpha [Cyanothece sp. SIO2G6]